MKSALVIGGTGPTGPHIVNGLLVRAFEVSILHGGHHETVFQREVEHIHADVHFAESLEAALGSRRWEVVIATYGRLQLSVEALRGHTERVIAVGGSVGGIASSADAAWGPLGRPAILTPENAALEANPDNKFRYRMAQAEKALFAAHDAGYYSATYLGYPMIYGPLQPGPNDWSIVRRILDRRPYFVVADGGVKLQTRAYTENAAAGVLAIVDNPTESAGKKFVVTDDDSPSLRTRIEFMAKVLGHQFELIDMPYSWAIPAYPLWQHTRESTLIDGNRIRTELGYRAPVSTAEGLRRSAEWLVQNPLDVDGAAQVGDPFDYAREDELIATWKNYNLGFPLPEWRIESVGHMYRHPTVPNERWKAAR